MVYNYKINCGEKRIEYVYMDGYKEDYVLSKSSSSMALKESVPVQSMRFYSTEIPLSFSVSIRRDSNLTQGKYVDENFPMGFLF